MNDAQTGPREIREVQPSTRSVAADQKPMRTTRALGLGAVAFGAFALGATAIGALATVRLTMGLRKDGSWLIAHEHHSYPID